MPQSSYNERSWAIDLISEINSWCKDKELAVKRAGGERTIRTKEGSKFPDVMLFGDDSAGLIIQGWELKFPDTSIHDVELISNAKLKAQALNLNSFLVWNVTTAVLYQIEEPGSIREVKSWNQLSHIRRREDVEAAKQETFNAVQEIMTDLNDYFSDGVIRASTIVDSFTGSGITNMITANLNSYASALRRHSSLSSEFEDEVNLWWSSAKYEYPDETDKWRVIARNNLIGLLNKFIFAHSLKQFNKAAELVDSVEDGVDPKKGLKIFENISVKADFWNIFNKSMGEEHIPGATWESFISLNELLKEVRIEKVDSTIIHDLLSQLVHRGKRKVAGQFSTPYSLANILARLVVLDPSKNVLDPFCGTGTIARAAYNLKKDKAIPKPLDTVWASDKFAFPLKMATLSMTEPENIGKTVKIFREDAFDLNIGQEVLLHDAYTGKAINVSLPKFSYVISNLPFVQQEDAKNLNPAIGEISKFIKKTTGDESLMLGSRSDLYAYIPFQLWGLLEDGGRLGIIVSNSWLATAWGEQFFKSVKRFFKIESIIASSAERWFKDAKVVTNILIMQKINRPEERHDQNIKFIALKRRISNFNSDQISELRAHINRSNSSEIDQASIKVCDNKMLAYLEKHNLPKSVCFTDISWLHEAEQHSLRVNELLDVNRGERRGWDALFYPNDPNDIEKEYLKPVLLTPRSAVSYKANPDGRAFCCALSEEELLSRGHSGALNWIKSFKKRTNGNGEPLPVVLKRAGMQWYTMLPNTLADFVTAINFGDRLFFSKFDEPTFVNQRLIRLSAKKGKLDLDLVHALLNSVLGIFYLEALGFGRGEGALDLNSTKLQEGMRILNPDLINEADALNIKKAFSEVKTRNILPLEQELLSADRQHFDKITLTAFGLSHIHEDIEKSLLELYRMRVCVNS